MERRVEVDEAQSPVEIPAPVLNELYQHALETLPEECCGLILGNQGRRFQQLIRARNEMTQRHHDDPVRFPRDGREAFYMSDRDVIKAQQQADAAACRVTAVYHSHVGSGAYLSEMDLQYAEQALFPFPDADQIVVAVFEGRVRELGVFRRDGDARGFVGRLACPRVTP